MKRIIFFALALLSCACGTTQYIPVETVKTTYRDNHIRDSIFRYDSVFVQQKADTVILERYRYLYRDKITKDSVFIRDTIRIPLPVEVIKQTKAPLSAWQNFQLWCGRITLVIGLLIIAYFLLKLKRKLPF